MCLYLPDGRIGFMFARPEIADDPRMEAGGLKIDVIGPFKQLGHESDTGTAVPSAASARMSIYDNAIDPDAARDVLEAAGGTDLRPIQ